MEKKMFAFASVLAGFCSLMIFSSFNETEIAPTTAPVNEPSGLKQHISSYGLDKAFSFAGEVIPEENFDALERLDRELIINAYLHSAMLMNIKLANRYFPVIETILEKYGIPEDFKYLCVAESNLRMAVSPAGAKGLWQFMEVVGKAYGLEINAEVDERYHVERSTEAACRFILHLKKRFGTWTMAAAAYNMGETILNKRITDQLAGTFYDLNLNEETSRYVFRVMAIKEIMKDPELFGFYVAEDHLYAPMDTFDIVTVEGPIPALSAFAAQHSTSYRMLKVYNPWLIGTALTNKSGKHYEIRVPKV